MTHTVRIAPELATDTATADLVRLAAAELERFDEPLALSAGEETRPFGSPVATWELVSETDGQPVIRLAVRDGADTLRWQWPIDFRPFHRPETRSLILSAVWRNILHRWSVAQMNRVHEAVAALEDD